MAEQGKKRGRGWIGLLAGLLLGAGGVSAHFQGMLNPVYHAVGFHGLMVGETHDAKENGPSAALPGGHAGHGGMPGMSGMNKPGEAAKVPGYSIVNLTPERIQRIGVRTGKVKHGELVMSIRAVGIIEVDQKKLARLHTRISGWVTKVHVDYVGQDVKKGDPLLEIYSPDLLTSQEEYLIAVAGGNKSLADSTRRRLELFGVPPDELNQLEKTKKARETLVLRAPIDGRVLERNVLEGSRVEPANELYRIADLSVVWLQARIYEYELPHVTVGQKVHIKLLSQPETTIQGEVAFVEPVLQEVTRTVKVRVPIKNTKELLFKPGMYADVMIVHEMGHGLLIPESALLRTGERSLAFRVLGAGRFEPVEVSLGSRFGEWYEIRAGLSEGDEVVTSAVFLIDAESRLKSAVSAFGHQHGGDTGKKPAVEKPAHEHSGHPHE